MYPTAPKLVASALFGFVAWFTASLIVPHIREVMPGAQLGWFFEVCAGVGIVCGWIMSGRHAGRGQYASLGFALTTLALIVFWGIFICAGNEAFERSIATRYDGPIEAISDMILLMIEYFKIMFKPDVVIALVVGSVCAGVVTELSSREWS